MHLSCDRNVMTAIWCTDSELHVPASSHNWSFACLTAASWDSSNDALWDCLTAELWDCLAAASWDS